MAVGEKQAQHSSQPFDMVHDVVIYKVPAWRSHNQVTINAQIYHQKNLKGHGAGDAWALGHFYLRANQERPAMFVHNTY